MGMVMLPPGVTWEQYNGWLQNTPEGQQYAQYINQAGAGFPTGVSHAPPMQRPGQFQPIGQSPAAGGRQPPQGGAFGGDGTWYPNAPVASRAGGDVAAWGSQQAAQQALPGRPVQQLSPGVWVGGQPAPGRAQPIPPSSQGTPYGQESPYEWPVGEIGLQAGLQGPARWAAAPQDFGHQYDPWAGAQRAPGQPLNRGGPSIGPTKYIGRDGKPMYAH
jgi:hypothetical protein